MILAMGGLFLVCLLDPTNRLFGIKELAFAACMGIGAYKHRHDGLSPTGLGYVSMIVFFLIPMGLLIGIGGEMDQGFALATVKALLFSSIILLADWDPNGFMRAFKASVGVFMVCFGAIAVAFLFGLGGARLERFFATENLRAGYRSYGPVVVPMIYYMSSALLVFPVGIYLEDWLRSKSKKSLIIAAVSVVLLFLSGTRANMLGGIGLVLLAISCRLTIGFRALVGAGILGYGAVEAMRFIGDSFLTPEEGSIVIKFGHLHSYLDLFAKDPMILIHGRGLGQSFHSISLNEPTFITELVYFDLVRYWGAPVLLLFLGIPSLSAIRSGRGVIMPATCVGYLAIAGTNPLLLSSTGFMAIALIFAWSRIDARTAARTMPPALDT